MRLRNHVRAHAIGLVLILTLIASIGLDTATGATKLVIHINKGIGTATLGMTQVSAEKAIGSKPSKTGKDSEYEGRVVYYSKFGKANKDGTYPIEITSDSKKKVFMFAFNSSVYATDEGIKIGSAESALTKAYGKKLGSKKSRVNTHYWLGGKTGTDFYAKNGKVTGIIVRNF
jgi:hypothetical protein